LRRAEASRHSDATSSKASELLIPLVRHAVSALRLLAVLLVGLAALTGAALAQPRDVEVGAFVTSLSDVDPNDGTFRIVFYVWFNDPAGRFDLERDLYPIARSVTIGELETEPAPGGGTYTFARIEAHVDHEFYFRDFPFDRQRLTLRLEATENTDGLRFTPDLEDTSVSEYLHLVGWTVDGLTLETDEHTYDTGFGYWTGRDDGFSQIALSVDVTRIRSPVLIDDFLGFTFAFLITSLTFVVSCTELGLRVGMTTGSLFAAMANLLRLDDAVGLKPEFGLIDRLAFLIFGAIVTSLVISLTTNRLSKHGEPEAAKARANRIDTVLGVLCQSTYLALIVWTVHDAMG
jgi:hypothetical protein